MSMLMLFEELWQDFEGGDVAVGLARLRTPPLLRFADLSEKIKQYLVSIARQCPDLLRQQDGSSIASVASDGTLYTVHEFDETEELGAMRFAMTSAFEVAKTRGMDKEEFYGEARKLFNTETGDYEKTFKYVVPDDFQPQAGDDGATAESDLDAISTAAANAFANWCKHKPIGTFDLLVIKVFKQM